MEDLDSCNSKFMAVYYCLSTTVKPTDTRLARYIVTKGNSITKNTFFTKNG